MRLATLVALAGVAAAEVKSLADIKHVVLIMMENRSFQHYFGTMAGVRGFADPNVQKHPGSGLPVWYQPDGKDDDGKTKYVLPFWLNDGSDAGHNKSQCVCAGANNWLPTHRAVNGGANDGWVAASHRLAWGYQRRVDMAYHYALADAWTVGDMYHAAVLANTDPNRWYWQSGTINVPGSKTPLDWGGTVLDNNQVNGCTRPNVECLPLRWPALAQKLEENAVDWRSYQEEYNWATNNGLFYFEAFQQADKESMLYKRGLAFGGDNSFAAFKTQAAEGRLPEVSWAFPPQNLQEHPPYTPQDGAWWLNELISPIVHGKGYNDTLVILNYDEGGGWGDAVMPIRPANGTAGEWFTDPFGELGYTWAGPGVRVPLVLISPYTRGGQVFVERGDHSSVLQFLETWLAARGHGNVTVNDTMSDWRREHMSDLTAALDFAHPDYSIPDLPTPATPIQDSKGRMVGLYAGFCEKQFGKQCASDAYAPRVPKDQTLDKALVYEDGFKRVRGQLTEGRHLVFEARGFALAAGDDRATLTATPATADHADVRQRWVLHALAEEGTLFNLSSAASGHYLAASGRLASSVRDAAPLNIAYLGASMYALQTRDGTFLGVGPDGAKYTDKPVGHDVFSVTYH